MTLRTIAAASKLVRSQEVSPVELVRECLEKIAALNSELSAFVTVMADSALRDATRAESEIRAGKWLGPLHGIPVGLKDLMDVTGVRTSAGSRVVGNEVSSRDAALVVRLKQAGAILIGKQNLHEFAYGGSSVISCFGPVHNPVHADYIAGGSSGGSAAAVASGMCFASVGTDTAGSIREPAALCGVVGLKPSFGLISTEGVIPLSPSLDHAGPITRSVEDAAILLDALGGSAGQYSGTLAPTRPAWRVGVPRQFFFEGLDREVAASVEEAIRQLERLGSTVADVSIRVDSDRTLQAAEAYAVHQAWIRKSAEDYDPETLRRIRTGENISADQYQAALKELAHLREESAAMFQTVDLLVTPTTPIPAPRLSDLVSHVEQLRPTELILLRNTRPANVWGTPAISVPCGLTSEGLPIGLQIVGPSGHDARVLQLAFAFEQSRITPRLPG
ncbi:MAG TPA: amidase [Terriglobales bacterium]|jgi:aspartyl-tRNA(Asn)/glutamyl-tRNA(Gln) amidotransferase subunit A|nr:amidase [Terriglobales bacterium]